MSVNERTPIVARPTTNGAPYILICVAATQLIAAAIVISTTWDQATNEHCGSVNGWLIAYCSRLVFVIILGLVALYFPLWTVRSPLYESCTELANLTSFVLFVIGAYIALHTTDECATRQHAIYMLMIWLLMLNCFLTYSPLLCLIACCPCLYLLAPSIIRYLQLLADDRHGLSPNAIAQLPVVEYPSLQLRDTSWPSDCAICLADFEAGQKLVRLTCHQQHCFHQTCLTRWARTNNSCPLCRASLRHDPNDNDDDEEEERMALVV